MLSDKKYPVVYTEFENNILDVGLKISNDDYGILAPSIIFDKRFGNASQCEWLYSGFTISINDWYSICIKRNTYIYENAKTGTEILSDIKNMKQIKSNGLNTGSETKIER